MPGPLFNAIYVIAYLVLWQLYAGGDVVIHILQLGNLKHREVSKFSKVT